MDYSSQNHIGYCRFENPGGPVTWAGSRLYNNSNYNRIYNCTFTKYGKESYYSGSYQDSGCILDIGNDNDIDNSDYNLVVNNTFYHGGHHILGVYANYNVVRNNTFHNEEWYDCHRSNIGGKCGNRNVILNTSYAENNIFYENQLYAIYYYYVNKNDMILEELSRLLITQKQKAAEKERLRKAEQSH